MATDENNSPEKAGDFISAFRGSIPQSETDKREGLLHGLVSLDANVLLNFYRFSPTARTALLQVLERVGDRLFVSHQAAKEFWRNRAAVIDERDAATRMLREQVDKASRTIETGVATWSKRTAATESAVTAIKAAVSEFRNRVETSIDEEAGDDEAIGYQIGQDQITTSLLSLLTAGRVGLAPSDAERVSWIKEAQVRIAEDRPPGYMDAQKEGSGLSDGGVGDYFVWRESLDAASRRQLPLVIVTGDEKEDWWWRHRGTLLGPRQELFEECKSEIGRPLVMLRPQDLVQLADTLNVKIDPGVAADIERASHTPKQPWTESAVNRLLELLDAEGWPHALVIRAAAENGGIVGRAEVFDLCGYDEDRMLRGFTRPVRRLTRQLVAEGLLEDEPWDMLTPDYGGGVTAVSFGIPPEVVELMHGPAA